MPLLKSVPPVAVGSLEEMFAIAQAMEREAAARYAGLAQRARAEGVAQLADLFEKLAEEERAHETSVVRWSQEQSGKPPDAAAIRWDIPETFDEEAAGELAVSRLASAYRILSMAVRNEERAFMLWSAIAAQAERPDVRQAAERMALEKLDHVALLRRARRDAYHAERARRAPERARSVADRLFEAGVLERRLAAQLEAMGDQFAGDNERLARELAGQSRQMAADVERLAPRAGSDPEELEAAAAAERLVEDYLGIGDLTRDEALALQIQSLAQRAISRLAWLRSLNGGAHRAPRASGEPSAE